MTAALPAAAEPAEPAPPPARRKPYLTIRANGNWMNVNIREMWLFRDLLWSLTARDIKLRYKQTALGIIWVIAQPLGAAGILSFVFGKLARLPVDQTTSGQQIPYFLYMFASLVVWNFFAGVINKVSFILVSNSSLVSKVYFPRLLLPLSGGMGLLVDLGVSACMLVVLQIIAGVSFEPQILLVPVILLLVLSAALGAGMWAAALAVQYRDVAYILPVLVQFLFFASPIAYSVNTVHGRGAIFFQLNPITGMLGIWRWAVLGTPFPSVLSVLYATLASLLMLLAGVMVFRRMERTFADVI